MKAAAKERRFLELLEEHRKILFKVAGAYARDPEDRRDLLQEMAAQLWRSFGRYDTRLRFSTWMYRIALNVAISFVRRESRRRDRTASGDPSDLELPAPPGEGDQVRRLHERIGRLDELSRALVILHLDGYRHEEIAEVLGITETNVATKLGRIKERLRRDLGTAVAERRGE